MLKAQLGKSRYQTQIEEVVLSGVIWCDFDGRILWLIAAELAIDTQVDDWILICHIAAELSGILG